MDLTLIQPLLDWLNLHQQWVAAAIVLIAFLESLALAGVVIPGVLLLFGASAVAGSGALGIWPTLACAFFGAVLGDSISFFLGKQLKQHIKKLWPFRNYPDWIRNGESFFARHGGKSIVIGRFVGPIRPVIPLVAGMLDMSSARFVSINLCSALAWAPTYVVPGFLFGASIQWGTRFPEGFNQLIISIIIAAVAGFAFTRFSHWHLSPESKIYRATQNWAQRQHHVRLFWYWLAERRHTGNIFPLTSLTLLFISSAIFALFAYLVSSTDWLVSINQQTFNYFQSIQHPWLDRGFAIITMLGDDTAIELTGGILLLWLILKRHFAAALISFCVILISESSVAVLKHSFAIARPLVEPGAEWSTGSFPSGHTTRATLLFGLIATFIAQEFHHKQRWWIYGIALVPMLLMAISRLYLKQHWLSDVTASVFLGLAFCALGRVMFSPFNRKPVVADLSLLLSVIAILIGLTIYMTRQYPVLMGWING